MDNPNVAIINALSDNPGDPLNCEDWGDKGDDRVPIIINDYNDHTFGDWFGITWSSPWYLIIDQNFMLLCGFEKFDNFYVRIDILERLFIIILNSKKDDRTNEIKLTPEMLNLLGCNKENFIKLIQKMNYKICEKENNLYFKHIIS